MTNAYEPHIWNTMKSKHSDMFDTSRLQSRKTISPEKPRSSVPDVYSPSIHFIIQTPDHSHNQQAQQRLYLRIQGS